MTPLERELVATIRARGPIAFVDFMDAALHDPQHGYYGSGRVRFGRRGDFTTASGLDAFFGVAISAWALDVWRALDRPERFVYAEVGPGTGRLARDVAAAVLGAEDRPARFEVLLVERSPALRAESTTAVERLAPARAVDTLAGERFAGVVVANELVDALPVRRLRRRGPLVEECYVGLDPHGALVALWLATRDALPAEIAGLLRHDGAEVEVRPAAAPWVREVADAVVRGAALVIDYGGEREALFGATGPRGTIRGFRDHRLVADPLVDPGFVDLTADVDFTSLAEAATEAGLRPRPRASLTEFLTRRGLVDLAARRAASGPPDAARLASLLALKQFLAPGGIGGAMQVLELSKL